MLFAIGSVLPLIMQPHDNTQYATVAHMPSTTHHSHRQSHIHSYQYKMSVMKSFDFQNFFCFTAIDCGILEDIADGFVDFDGTSFGSTATYACNGGFVLMGKGIRQCLDDGQWSGVEPFCEGQCMIFASIFLLHIWVNVQDCYRICTIRNNS